MSVKKTKTIKTVKNQKSDPKKFWDKGIRFECQQTAGCCASRGEYGYIYLTRYDQTRFARYFNLNIKDFREKYCDHTDDPVYYLKGPEKDCQFLEGHKCSVYKARPTQCRTWPFWPENMNPRVWKKEVSAFCPGIGKGKLYTQTHIKKLLKKDLFYSEYKNNKKEP